MLDKLVTFFPPGAREALRALATRRPLRQAEAGPTVLPSLDTRPAPMAPLLPPAATTIIRSRPSTRPWSATCAPAAT